MPRLHTSGRRWRPPLRSRKQRKKFPGRNTNAWGLVTRCEVTSRHKPLRHVLGEHPSLGALRSSSAHGKANMVRFNFFKDMGAFSRDENTGTSCVNFERMQEAMTALSKVILTLQGDGDYEAAAQLVREKGVIGPQLQQDLDRLDRLGIPVDVVFEQGMNVQGPR